MDKLCGCPIMRYRLIHVLQLNLEKGKGNQGSFSISGVEQVRELYN